MVRRRTYTGLHHIRGRIVDAGPDREDDRHRRKGHEHGHGATFLAAEAVQLATRGLKKASKIRHGEAPKLLPITATNGRPDRRALMRAIRLQIKFET